MYAQASYDAKTANFLKKNEDYINKTLPQQNMSPMVKNGPGSNVPI